MKHNDGFPGMFSPIRICAAITPILLWTGILPGPQVTGVCAAAIKRPNIILIVADDLGGTDLGCYGSKYHKTPHVDRLASEGMRFTQAYAACPVCSPTRAALMTGRYPARLHLTDWLPGRPDRPEQRLLRPDFAQQLPLEEVTLAERLQAAGYTTGHIGKWHLGGSGFGPLQQGFQLNIGGTAAGSPPGYFAPFERNGQPLPGLESAAPGDYLPDSLTQAAEQFLEQHREHPFFLHLAHFAVHTPLQGKADLVRLFEQQPRPGLPQNNPVYAAMLASLDESVGRILQKLTDLQLADQTLVVFTSDNGGLATTEGPNTPATSNAPFREGKGYLYEGGLRVPFLVRWPGTTTPGSTCDVPISSIDLVPTISELLGEGLAAGTIDGISLVPLLKQQTPAAPRPLFWHYPHYSNQGGRPGGAIRVGNDKLIEFYETGRLELFDLARDPSENTNLIDKFPEKAAQLAARLQNWRQTVGAQTMRPNPDYLPNPQANDGTITLLGKAADVHGVMLRFEPLPHKNTLGFWVREDDWASWEFHVTQPGEFLVEVVTGCGNGSGGSEVDFNFDDQSLRLTVQETGGFQNFVRRELGTIRIEQPGRHTLQVKPVRKPGVAVMDLPEVKLIPR